jgi:hypothetical protein
MAYEPMNWAGAIEKNCDDLMDIVARLFALTGTRTHRMLVAALPRGLCNSVLAILRPAEFAARRLILIAALTLTVPPPRKRAAGTSEPKPTLPESDPVAGASGAHQRGRSPKLTDGTDKVPAFALFDPFKPFGSPWLTEEQIARLENPDAWPSIPAPQLPQDEPVCAHGLCRRIHALRNALVDLEGHALRLARWRARMSAHCWSDPSLPRLRPHRSASMRPGLPPGWKKHPKMAIELVLKECHSLAIYALNPPDTS